MTGPVIVLLGAPGSGKGTQGALLARLLQVPVISTGDILRAECQAGTPLGKMVEARLHSGELVEDDLINSIVDSRISQADCAQGFLLDGFPRTAAQAQWLDRKLDECGVPLPTVLQITVPAKTLVARLTGRLQCTYCGRAYNSHFRPPAHEGFCDDDGMPLVRRADDKESIIRERLRVYDKAIAPLIQHYRDRSFHRIDGSGGPGMVLEAIENALGLCAVGR